MFSGETTLFAYLTANKLAGFWIDGISTVKTTDRLNNTITTTRRLKTITMTPQDRMHQAWGD